MKKEGKGIEREREKLLERFLKKIYFKDYNFLFDMNSIMLMVEVNKEVEQPR